MPALLTIHCCTHDHFFVRFRHRCQPGCRARCAIPAGCRAPAPLVAPTFRVGGVAGLARHGCCGVGLDAATARHPGAAVRDRGGAARGHHAHRLGHGDAAAHALGHYWQRAVGYRAPGAGGCERPHQEGPGAGGAGHRQALGAGAAFAGIAGVGAGAAGAGPGHAARGTGQPGAAGGSGPPVGWQGAFGGRAGCGPRRTRARPGR